MSKTTDRLRKQLEEARSELGRLLIGKATEKEIDAIELRIKRLAESVSRLNAN